MKVNIVAWPSWPCLHGLEAHATVKEKLMQTQENMSDFDKLSRADDKVIEGDESKLVPVTESIRYRKFILRSSFSLLIRRRKGTLVAAKFQIEAGGCNIVRR